MNRDDLKALAELRIEEARYLSQGGFHCGAYYLMGYAVECALKASIASQIREHDFPDKKLVNDSYVHDLKKLLDVSGLKSKLEEAMAANAVLELNWSLVKDWSEGARYRHDITAATANDFIEACISKPDGVFPWLTNWW
ncbi:MAG: DNA-binding protein [Chthoniobacterales bacterium]